MFNLFAEGLPPAPPVDPVWYWITVLFFILTQLAQLYRQFKTEGKIDQVEKGVDGKIRELVDAKVRAAKLEGFVEGQESASGVNLGGVRVPDSPQKLSPKSPQGDSGIAKPPDQAP